MPTLTPETETKCICTFCANEIEAGAADILFDVESIKLERDAYRAGEADDHEEAFCGLCRLPLWSGDFVSKARIVWATEED